MFNNWLNLVIASSRFIQSYLVRFARALRTSLLRLLYFICSPPVLSIHLPYTRLARLPALRTYSFLSISCSPHPPFLRRSSAPLHFQSKQLTNINNKVFTMWLWVSCLNSISILSVNVVSVCVCASVGFVFQLYERIEAKCWLLQNALHF